MTRSSGAEKVVFNRCFMVIYVVVMCQITMAVFWSEQATIIRKRSLNLILRQWGSKQDMSEKNSSNELEHFERERESLNFLE